MKKERFKEQLFDFLKKNAYEQSLYSGDWPDSQEALISITEEEFPLEKDDIFVSSGNLSIDSDGFPYTQEHIHIKSVNLHIYASFVHHNEWDFYIEDISLNAI